MRIPPTRPILGVLAVFFATGAFAAAPGPDRPWSDGFTLVRLEPGADPRSATDFVLSRGGSVAVVVPPQLLLGWIPPSADAALLGREGIGSIHRDAPPGLAESFQDPAARAAVRTFERAVRGELDPAAGAPQADADLRMLPDARDPGVIPADEVRANLRGAGKGRLAAAIPGDVVAGNSDFMSGTVSLTLFFVESDGSGADPDVNNWTAGAEQEVFNGAVSGLAWWSQQAQNYGSCWVAFYVHAFFATQDARCSQWREPVLHPSGDYSAAISAVLGNFGYTSGSDLSRAAAFNTSQRSVYGTDWAYCAFVGANPNGPNQFTDGYSAWAYLGGPYTALLQHSFGWPFGQVFAHESGHIFRACDEYYQPGYGGCGSCGPCGTTGVDNGNCEACNPASVPCMMKSNSWTLCTYTPGQVGWWRNPCGPGQLPAPQLASVSPDGMDQAGSGVVQLSGQNFTYGMQASFGPGVQVVSVLGYTSTSLAVQVEVDLDAAPGPRDVTVVTPDQQWDTLPEAFEVRATTRHYASPTGGDVYPFTTPSGAGTSLAAVLAACSEGDTVLLAAGTYPAFAIQRTLTLLGGWNGDFTARAPQATPSIVQGDGTRPAARLTGAGKTPVLDGLVLRGGSGETVSPSATGTALAGGGVSCYSAAARIVDCLVEGNTAGISSTPGLGGGVFFWLADGARMERCTVRGNRATRGAGVFCIDSNVDLLDNLVESNQGDATAEMARGAGLGALGSRLSLSGDIVRGNTGAGEGGGMHLEACPSVELDGVLVENHAASGPGGGILSRSSRLVLRASAVLANTAGATGGGIDSGGDSLVVVASRIAGNQAGGLGGGVRASDCVLQIENATVARNTGSYGSGLFSEGTLAGSRIEGSVVASNTLGGIVNLTGAAPALDWNLVWGNGSLDTYGAAPGANDISADPRFADANALDLHLALHSPCIDSGDPALADPDGSRNDRGAYGGPWSRPDAPPRVQGLSATIVGSEVHLAWSASAAPDVALYAVYRSTDSTQVAAEANYLGSTPAPGTTWADASPVPGAWYVVSAVDASGYAGGLAAPVRATPPTDALGSRSELALQVVSPASPKGGIWVQFALPEASRIRLAVYSVDGRRLRTLFEGRHAAGPGRAFWDARDADGRAVATGVYLLRLGLDHRTLTRKLVLAP